jgi:hypothetical protein
LNGTRYRALEVVMPSRNLIAGKSFERAVVIAAVLVGCSHAAATAQVPPLLVEASDSSSAKEVPAVPLSPVDAGVDAHGPTLAAASPSLDAPHLQVSKVADVLFLDGDVRPSCELGDDTTRIHCLIAARFVSDERARTVALDLYDRTGDLAGLSPGETMEGGWRGTLHLVPALPVGRERAHLEWVAEATRDYDTFFEELAHGEREAPRYVWRGLSFRFMRSVAAHTPSAYASGWTIAYNLDGSLNKSADAVRELLFHESFHLNDEAHGDWSVRVLGATFNSIVARCGTKVACLAPFAPTDMTVRGGTYYAFQPNNGAAVREYAAELALRYYREQRTAQRGLVRPRGALATAKRFKCGPKENASSWKLLVDEFFGGIDRAPACE